MGKSKQIDAARQYWESLYGSSADHIWHKIVQDIDLTSAPHTNPEHWYKDAIVYALYVDKFAGNFEALVHKLDYLRQLGVTCLWLLPFLESPLRDDGFDVSDYFTPRASLFAETGLDPKKRQEKIKQILSICHQKGFRVIFDLPLNHTSDEHPWFQAAKHDPKSIYRHYYVWSQDNTTYQDAKIIFSGIEESNWQQVGDWYYWHRFFFFQPDLNYRNPRVAYEMIRVILHWIRMGIDGFRADALPYLWENEGGIGESEPENHILVKLFRAIIESVAPGTLLLAEAAQSTEIMLDYLKDDTECQAVFHFGLMPELFRSMATESAQPILVSLESTLPPNLPHSAAWFTFLRLHDELTLETLPEQDKQQVYEHYGLNPAWNFRRGQGIATRLADLLDRKETEIELAFSLLFSLPGTPVMYYGDEVAWMNDETHYEEKRQETGIPDTRYYVRGPLRWKQIEQNLSNPLSLSFHIYSTVSTMMRKYQEHSALRSGNTDWTESKKTPDHVLAFDRFCDTSHYRIYHNLSFENSFSCDAGDSTEILYQGDNTIFDGPTLTLGPRSFAWLRLK